MHKTVTNGCSPGEFLDGLGALRDGMFGELTWEQEFDGALDLPGGQSTSPVVSDQLGGLSGESVKGIINKGVHNVHGFLGDSDLWVDLFEDLVDVERERFNSSFGPADWGLSSASNGFGGFSGGHF